mmetsp:Transcript_27965/g.80133  ORF Transcript_27965/g.80133 Transcript_27965/m.80133 type:complete len:231 (-) Transcript_27965:1178-1870(-)
MRARTRRACAARKRHLRLARAAPSVLRRGNQVLPMSHQQLQHTTIAPTKADLGLVLAPSAAAAEVRRAVLFVHEAGGPPCRVAAADPTLSEVRGQRPSRLAATAIQALDEQPLERRPAVRRVPLLAGVRRRRRGASHTEEAAALEGGDRGGCLLRGRQPGPQRRSEVRAVRRSSPRIVAVENLLLVQRAAAEAFGQPDVGPAAEGRPPKEAVEGESALLRGLGKGHGGRA